MYNLVLPITATDIGEWNFIDTLHVMLLWSKLILALYMFYYDDYYRYRKRTLHAQLMIFSSLLL